MHTVLIDDDFDLAKISWSGQCFRARTIDDAGAYRFIAGNELVDLRQVRSTGEYGAGEYKVSCSAAEWEGFWHHYFDLDRNYRAIRESAYGRNEFIDRCIDCGAGLRVLNQQPWEMLVTFIISQRKSMPAIASAVEALCTRFGETIGEDESGAPIFAFPTPEALATAAEGDLKACSLGYRVPYVRSAAEMVASGEMQLEALAALSDEELFEELQRVHGVGKKVANCVCLFGYGRCSMVPVDVWIERAINEDCEGVDPFAQFGENAGIIQQYVFYYMTHRKQLDQQPSNL